MDSSTPKGPKEAWKDEIGTTKTPKDKSCPYCGQAFTSSSLGRHLDLYIREKKPKPPDGIHDVVAIRKLRENITRRQPRGAAKRETSTPAATPTNSARRSPVVSEAADGSTSQSLANQKEDGIGRQFPLNTPWEATGVIVNIPKLAGGEHGTAEQVSGGGGGNSAAAARSSNETTRTMLPAQRVAGRQAMKAQLDMKQKVQEALDTAKAAELALREIMSSWRAAKQQFDMNSMPFDFEPLALDFPALTLQCLQPPPTLFSSTQYPTTMSWSILPPGKRQYEALRSWFREEFRKWRISCQAATTAVNEDLTYSPSQSALKPDDVREAVQRAEKIADDLEAQVNEHIQTTFGVWDGLALQRQHELWILELARAVGRKQKDVEELKESQHRLKQENANLKSQIEHLSRLQQPQEYKLMQPMTMPMDQKLLAFMQEFGVSQKKSQVGFNMEGRHSDLNTIITAAIDRWKTAIVTARSVGGLNAQRGLNSTGLVNTDPKPDGPVSSIGSTSATANHGQTQIQQAKQPMRPTPPVPNALQSQHAPWAGRGATTKMPMAPGQDTKTSTQVRPPPAPTTGTVSVPTSNCTEIAAGSEDEEKEEQKQEESEGDDNEDEGEEEDEDDDMSDADADGDADADADAEMDVDGEFSHLDQQSGMSTPISSMPMQHVPQEQIQLQLHSVASISAQQGPLEVPRTRAPQPRFTANGATSARSVTHSGVQGAQGVPGGISATNRSLTNMQVMQHAHRMAVQNHHIHAQVVQTDMVMMQGVGDSMYME